MTTSRTFDITLLGATGFTGGLAAHYLAANAPASARLALAGRNRAKLEALAAALGRPMEIIVVDTTDDASVRAMADATRVVLTTVGPYI